MSPIVVPRPTWLAACTLLLVSACGGGAAPSQPTAQPTVTPAALTVTVTNAARQPVAGASVKVTTADGGSREGTANPSGIATFANLAAGDATVEATAAGYDPARSTVTLAPGLDRRLSLQPKSVREWAAGQAVLLDSRVVERAADGTSMVIGVDVAVIGENGAELSTLTAADFHLVQFDCGWGPRDCATNAGGEPANRESGGFLTDGGARAFEWRPAPARQPYVAAIVLDRYDAAVHWEQKIPALRAFFGGVGGNDVVTLASLQDGTEPLTVHGPFTGDGRAFQGTLDTLQRQATASKRLVESVEEMIRRTAAAPGAAGARRSLLLLSNGYLDDVASRDTVAALARGLGVRVAVANTSSYYDFAEVSARTAGLYAAISANDSRRHALLFAAMDRLLAGNVASYRMQFRVTGVPGTFVSGGNLKTGLGIDLPEAIPNGGLVQPFDVAIP